jgi:hypothetical protein
MSTLKVNSITPANAGSEDYFLARAWVNFNGTGTVAIRADGNVSSITDNGTGDYGVSYSSGISDASYAISGSAGRSNPSYMFSKHGSVDPTTSACRITCIIPNVNYYDETQMHVAVHR